TANGQDPTSATGTGNTVTSSFLLAYDPAAPYANLPSQADLPAQLVNFKEAANDFRASLLAYKTSSQMFKTLLDATA
ncbi:MAG TPA: hypothetical protein VH189_02455, partial [Rhizomicrobium sp.]|nr:hypothetical protein [Rhizomicrobium sp.]